MVLLFTFDCTLSNGFSETTLPMGELTYSHTAVRQVDVLNGIKLLIKREDQNHPFVTGNKWWKLKYNLQEAQRLNQDTLLTFGGAYSNHIYATAAAAREVGMNSIGIIRGDEMRPLNHTLAFAKSCGMKLHFVSREWYRTKASAPAQQELSARFGDFYLIPEGGTNEMAVKGCAEFANTLQREVHFDYLCLPVGTGGTMAGMLRGLDNSKTVVGISVLKGGGFLHDELNRYTRSENRNLQTEYHLGGYAKTTPELYPFIQDVEQQYEIPLDQVYTAKMMFGVFDLVQQNFFKPNSTVLMLHTGGLQGRTILNDHPKESNS